MRVWPSDWVVIVCGLDVPGSAAQVVPPSVEYWAAVTADHPEYAGVNPHDSLPTAASVSTAEQLTEVGADGADTALELTACANDVDAFHELPGVEETSTWVVHVRFHVVPANVFEAFDGNEYVRRSPTPLPAPTAVEKVKPVVLAAASVAVPTEVHAVHDWVCGVHVPEQRSTATLVVVAKSELAKPCVPSVTVIFTELRVRLPVLVMVAYPVVTESGFSPVKVPEPATAPAAVTVPPSRSCDLVSVSVHRPKPRVTLSDKPRTAIHTAMRAKPIRRRPRRLGDPPAGVAWCSTCALSGAEGVESWGSMLVGSEVIDHLGQ
jgi:hypothetical protein